MFGGATNYVETLDAILEFVAEHEPTTAELIGWHRGSFDAVSSKNSILRRVEYLEDVGFLERTGDETWTLGAEGRRYYEEQSTATLVEIMCRRNVGLRSLLYALLPGPLSIEAISRQQLETHPDLGWDLANTDMAKQRTAWLRSLGLVEKRDGEYALTDDGREFAERAVSEWREQAPARDVDDPESWTVGSYSTTVQARAIDPEFRETALTRYDSSCPVSGVDHRGLLDVAHVLPWSDYPDHRADLSNVLALSTTHHAAFDRELFTIDTEYRLRVDPAFETESDLLQTTLVDRAGEPLSVLDGRIDPAYLSQHNEAIPWVAE